MPMPSTSKWPKPRSEDEFEDMVVDFFRVRWQDPNATRYGRRGQRQHGVDITGRPTWLKGKTAGAQCKNTDSLTLATVKAEAEKARSFPGGLAEFFIVTTGDRDASLQSEVREHFRAHPEPFHIEVLFWPDVVADLSSDDRLVAKHWKGFPEAAIAVVGTPPATWIDRDGVNVDEKAVTQCELALWLPDPAPDLDASELLAEVAALVEAGNGGPVIRVLLNQPSTPRGRNLKWSFRQRSYTNVIEKWELEFGRKGFLAFRWSQFRTGELRLLDTMPLLDGVLLPTAIHRRAIEVTSQKLGLVQPAKTILRLAVDATGPVRLNDTIRVTTDKNVMTSFESPARWTVDVEADAVQTPFSVAVRLLNRALANFSPVDLPPAFLRSSGPSVPPRIDEGAMTRFYNGGTRDPLPSTGR